MRGVVVASLAVVAGCAEVDPVPRPFFPDAGVGSSVPVGSADSPVRQVTIGGRSFEAASLGNLSFRQLPVCDAASEVLGTAGLNYTCSASGLLSFETSSDDPTKVVPLFLSALERMGVVVTVSPSGFVLASGGGRGAAGDDPSLSQAEGFSPVDGGAVSAGFDDDFGDVVLDRTLRVDPVNIASVPVGFDASDARSVIGALGLDVDVVSDRGSPVLVGSSGDVATAVSALKIGETGVLAVEIPPLSEDVMVSLSMGFGVDVSFDAVSGKTVFVGASHRVFDAVKAARDIGGTVTPVRVSVMFVRYSRSAMQSASLSASFAYDVGDVLLSGGTMSADGLRLTVAQENFASVASVVSSPSMVVVSGSEASFLSGRSVPVAGSVDDEGRQDIEYRDAGVSVVVVPYVSGGVVRADVSVEVSSVVAGADPSQPSFETTQVASRVTARIGEVVGLSGLSGSQDQSGDGRSLWLPAVSASSQFDELGIFLTFEDT